MRQFWSRYIVLPLALAMSLTLAGRAAHALGAECKLVGDRVEVEAYYDDDTAARDAKVQVEDVAKTVVATGRTDKAGRWSFARPRPGQYLVVVDAGAGHRTQLKITIPAADATGVAAAASSPDSDCKCCVEPGISAGSPPVSVSDGPDRRDFTRFPLLKAALGLAVIGGLGLAFFVSRRLRPADPGRAVANLPGEPHKAGWQPAPRGVDHG